MLLRDVDWTAHEDERWVVIGPNGAGKTTLLQVAAAQLFPTTGSVEVLGERLGEVDVFELRSRIGFASAAVADRVPPGRRSSTWCSPPPTRFSAGGRRSTSPPTSPAPSSCSTRSAART